MTSAFYSAVSSRVLSSRNKRANARARKSSLRPLEILPNLSEEDESQLSSQPPSPDATSSKQRALKVVVQQPSNSKSANTSSNKPPRPIGLSGVEDFSFDAMLFASHPPRRAPSPPSTPFSPALSDNSVVVNMDGLTLDFPRPPSVSPRSATAPLSSYRSSPTLSSSSASTCSPITPASSDDEFLLPPIRPLSIMKSKSQSPSHSQSQSPNTKSQHQARVDLNEMIKDDEGATSTDEWVDVDDEDARDYYYTDIVSHLQLLTVATRSPISSRKSSYSSLHGPARPDSMPPPPHSVFASRRRSSASSIASNASNGTIKARHTKARRKSKPLPAAPAPATSKPSQGPNPALDPSFPRKRQRSIPSQLHPPLPPPSLSNVIPVQSPLSPMPPASSLKKRTSSRQTRPPPRSSLPIDAVEFTDPFQEDDLFHSFTRPRVEEEIDPLSFAPISVSVTGPSGSTHAFGQSNAIGRSNSRSNRNRGPQIESSYPHDVPPLDVPVSPLFSPVFPSSNSNCGSVSGTDDSCGESYLSLGDSPKITLRSRWSSSTLGSLVESSTPRTRFPWFSSSSSKSSNNSKSEPRKSARLENGATATLKKSKSTKLAVPSKDNKPTDFLPTLTPPKSPSTKSSPKSKSVPKAVSVISTSTMSTSSLTSKAKPSKGQHQSYVHPYTLVYGALNTPKSAESFTLSPPTSPSPSPTRGLGGRGIRRRESKSSTHSGGSEESSSSRKSDGLRRKPIPIEIFLR